MNCLRKAQGGVNAAILVAVIAGLSVLYILFLPDAEREALLENKTIDRSDDEDEDDEDILLRVFPETLDETDDVGEKNIPNVFLFESTNAKELEKINPFIIRNGWFDKKSKTFDFELEDLGNTDNVILSFKAKDHDGILTVILNNELVFESDVDSETVDPIKLKKNLLKDQNTLEFSTSSVGMKFWQTNEYSLEDAKIVGDITDRSKQASRNIFTITSKELSNIEEANLRFVPYCSNAEDVGILDIEINSRNIFSAVPVCEDSYKQSVPIGLLDTGENKLLFKTSKGSYSVEQIRIDFEEKDTEEKLYFFEVNQSELDEIDDRDKNAILTIEFVNDDENKRADINVNDRFITLDDEDRVFTKNVNDYLEEGNNFIEVRPRTRLDIVELKIELEDR